jgi:hypothetical protein
MLLKYSISNLDGIVGEVYCVYCKRKKNRMEVEVVIAPGAKLR